MKEKEWLPGWKAVELPISDNAKTLLCDLYRRECEAMIEIGRKLFGQGVLPEFKGVGNGKIPQSYLNGTGGNFAVRNGREFIVTGAGTHKGRLTISDFTIVELVLWREKNLYFQSFGCRKPSTDSLLVAMALEVNPAITVWLHFHCPVDTPHRLCLSYPALQESDWFFFRTMLNSGARVINLIDHDLCRIPNGEPDSVIILGKNLEEAAELASCLILTTTGRQHLVCELK